MTRLGRVNCGATPAYNYYVATIDHDNLVVTLYTGVETGDAPAEQAKQVEVKRIPFPGTSLVIKPYDPSAH